ncbi:hypothetical protein [Haloferula sargassicola]|uniref:hypothetical protein n=1 Tax=Haloferula sargassicola TaxID=490096 RepID=UPI0033654C05
MNNLFKIIAVTWATVGVVLCSEEIALPLGSADVRGLSDIAGNVRIVIKSPRGGIESVSISAFGREISIPDKEFDKIRGELYSEVSISHEGGYKEFGGHTIYFFLRYFDSFGDPFEGARLQRQTICIVVPKTRPVRVTKERMEISSIRK